MITQSKDRKDYVYHPETGEKLSKKTEEDLKALRAAWGNESPDVQLIISDGLNALALTDLDHLLPFLGNLTTQLTSKDHRISPQNAAFTHGRVREGYAVKFFLENFPIPVRRKGLSTSSVSDLAQGIMLFLLISPPHR